MHRLAIMGAMTQTAIEWLLASSEPAIRAMTRREVVLGDDAGEDEAAFLEGPIVRKLFSGQKADGSFGSHWYRKWGGAHWRLVTLVELGLPTGEPRAIRAIERVVHSLTSRAHLRNVPVINGLPRRCASVEGNALAVASRLGLAGDERVAGMARSLAGWQWPDGGWNCDRRPEAHRSSFHESLATMWGLHEYARASGDTDAGAAARRTAELFLDHRLFRALKTGEPMHPTTLVFHWPAYWHYDALQAATVLVRMGLADDPRVADFADILVERRGDDGRWRAGRRWWTPPAPKGSNMEVVDWSRDETDDRMVTLNALRVLAAQGVAEPGRPLAMASA